MRTTTVGLLVVLLTSVACRQSDAPAESLRELATARAGNVDVVLRTADAGLSTGRDTITVEFRGASDGRLVDVGTVKASASMPMTGMAPMFGPVDVQPTTVPGRYTATTELDMAGEWRLAFEWNGPAGRGSVTFTPMVQ